MMNLAIKMLEYECKKVVWEPKTYSYLNNYVQATVWGVHLKQDIEYFLYCAAT